jgi:hypothetical protein
MCNNITNKYRTVITADWPSGVLVSLFYSLCLLQGLLLSCRSSAISNCAGLLSSFFLQARHQNLSASTGILVRYALARLILPHFCLPFAFGDHPFADQISIILYPRDARNYLRGIPLQTVRPAAKFNKNFATSASAPSTTRKMARIS